MPLFVVRLYAPPAAWPISAGMPVVNTCASCRVSTGGVISVLVSPRILAERLLGAYPVQRVTHLRFGLAENVISPVVIRLRAFLVIHEVLRLGLRDRRIVNVFARW